MASLVLGEQFLRLEEKEKARARLERALEENPQLGPARELLAGLLLEAGEVDRTFEVLEPVVRNAPDRFEVLAILGEAHFLRKQYAESVELLEKAIAQRRPDARLLNLLALAHHELGNDARAVEILERSLSLNPEQPPVQDLLRKLRAPATGDRSCA